MNDSGLNHLAPRDQIDLGLIAGTPIEALCGVNFVPTLRVGASGAADNPSLDVCTACECVMELIEEQNELAFKHRRVKAAIKAVKEAARLKVPA